MDLDDDTTIEAPAVIASRRRNHRADLLGLEIHPGTAALDHWSAQLLRASAAPDKDRPTSVAHETGTRTGRGAQLVDRVAMALVAACSVVAIAALVLVLLGFRPLVVRSGSMMPTYEVGDVVLVGQVRADELRDGDVASLEHFPDVGEGLTHRVREVRTADGTTEVETRGDANSSSENWAVSSDTMVGRVVASVPAIGGPATLVRTATAPLFIGVALVAVIVVLVLRAFAATPARPRSADRQGAGSSGRASRVP